MTNETTTTKGLDDPWTIRQQRIADNERTAYVNLLTNQPAWSWDTEGLFGSVDEVAEHYTDFGYYVILSWWEDASGANVAAGNGRRYWQVTFEPTSAGYGDDGAAWYSGGPALDKQTTLIDAMLTAYRHMARLEGEWQTYEEEHEDNVAKEYGDSRGLPEETLADYEWEVE